MIGLHPCDVKENYLEELAIFEEWLQKEKFVAIGEFGIDLYWNKRKFTKNGELNEIRKELQAQVDLGRSMGLNPSHIDSHEGALFFDPDIFKLYLDLAKENNLLAFVPIEASVHFDENFKKPKHAIIIDQFHMLPEGIEIDKIKNYYFDVIENLKPGLSQIIIHLGKDEKELREITIDHPNFIFTPINLFDLEKVRKINFKRNKSLPSII